MRIDKNIPMPRGYISRWEFIPTMDIGDSFEVESKKIATAARSYCKRVYKVKLVQRVMSKDPFKIRMWRVG